MLFVQRALFSKNNHKSIFNSSFLLPDKREVVLEVFQDWPMYQA